MSVIALVVGSADIATPGSGIKVQPVDLALLDPGGMPVGTAIYDTSANIWTLTVSTATVDGTTTEAVAGCDGLRWIKGAGGGGGGGGSSNATTPVDGAALTNADATINPMSGGFSRATLPVATLTANHTLTLGIAGTPPTGFTLEIVLRDLTAFSYTIKDDVGTTLFTRAPSPTLAQAVQFTYTGAHFAYVGVIFAA